MLQLGFLDPAEPTCNPLSSLAHLESFPKLLDTCDRSLDEARQIYREVETKGEGTVWIDRARERLQRLDEYQRESEKLLAEGKAASKAQNYEQAFSFYHDLLRKYPRSKAAKKTLLPVVISTLPMGGEITAQRPLAVEDPATHDEPRLLQRLGTSPVIVWIDPNRPVVVDITFPGYRSYRFILGSSPEHRMSVRLTPLGHLGKPQGGD